MKTNNVISILHHANDVNDVNVFLVDGIRCLL